jgi:hypothetical protein
MSRLPVVKRLAVVVVVVGLSLAACGGSSHPSSSSGPDAQTQIKNAYVKFFAPGTPLPQRVALLQNGSHFKPVIQTFASNPLAKSVSVSVSSVTLENANRAKVAFDIKLGSSSLGTQNGTAVRQNGTWKVGYAGLCRLVSLQGSTPSACKP